MSASQCTCAVNMDSFVDCRNAWLHTRSLGGSFFSFAILEFLKLKLNIESGNTKTSYIEAILSLKKDLDSKLFPIHGNFCCLLLKSKLSWSSWLKVWVDQTKVFSSLAYDTKEEQSCKKIVMLLAKTLYLHRAVQEGAWSTCKFWEDDTYEVKTIVTLVEAVVTRNETIVARVETIVARVETIVTRDRL